MPELDLSFRPRKATPPTRLSAANYAMQFVRYPRVQLYMLFAIVSTLAALLTFGWTWEEARGALAIIVAFPFVEYLIHRFVLHNLLLCRTPLTARFWSANHHLHHLHPTDSRHFFAPPAPILVTATLLSLLLGWLAGGTEGAGAGLAVGYWLIVVFAYVHGGAHLVAVPATHWGKAMRHRHMLHHLHNERVNFGVTTPLVDLLLGSSATDPETLERSPTIRSLGYEDEIVARYPWLAEIEAEAQPLK